MSQCPSCHERNRRPRQYLCSTCWGKLPPATRDKLYVRDGQALARYGALLRAINAGTPLEEITVA